MNRWICRECGNVFEDGDYLKAANPFDQNDSVIGCRVCKSIDSLIAACHDKECNQQASSGEKWPDGSYRWSCHEHSLWMHYRRTKKDEKETSTS